MTTRYRNGYDNRLYEPYSVMVPILGPRCGNGFVDLSANGVLTIQEKYSWDGPTGQR